MDLCVKNLFLANRAISDTSVSTNNKNYCNSSSTSGNNDGDSNPLGTKWARPIPGPETGCVLVAIEKLDGDKLKLLGFQEVVPRLYFGARNTLDDASTLVKKGIIKPYDFTFFTGYAGWKIDQLRGEIDSECWYAELSQNPKQDP
ncbi:unnamed protein product [Vicia faba]|uniref:YqgE/AlgH family protein n=1 Tax=Vicia faba TaxID=3906 RepID=A0AAV0ZAB5_VICFA|nr:unnamed protein product [Vicia faba]